MRRAQGALKEADVLKRAGHWNACAGRLSYACFFAAKALLLGHAVESDRHSSVRRLLNRQAIGEGGISSDQARFYDELSQFGDKADHEALAELDEALVTPWISQATQFVQRVEHLLNR